MNWEDELRRLTYNDISWEANDWVIPIDKAIPFISDLLKKQEKETKDAIKEINRVLWLDYFDDGSLSKEQFTGVDKYYDELQAKLNAPEPEL